MMSKINFITAIIFIFSCSKTSNDISHPNILAIVGDEVITVEEFIKRSEFTIRPAFCKGNSISEKKVILNNLILEKLIAAEAENAGLKLNDRNLHYLMGRIGQAMRQQLFAEVTSGAVKIDTSFILKNLHKLGRVYELSFMNFQNKIEAENAKIKAELFFNDNFSDIFTDKENYTKTLKWNESELPVILDVLYFGNIQINQVIGPIANNEGWTLLKVLGWNENPAITEGETKSRFSRFIDFENKRQGEEIYFQFIKERMKGKDLHFKGEIFTELIKRLGPVFYISEENRMNLKITQKKELEFLTDLQSVDLLGQELFSINDEIWTVDRVFELIKIRPLVFRKKTIRKDQFGQYLKWAMGDLIRDYYLTMEAKKRNLYQSEFVKSEVKTWKNYSVCKSYLKNKYSNLTSTNSWLTDDKFQSDMKKMIKKHMAGILIDERKLDSIQLTQINMHAIYAHEPFPEITPGILPLTISSWN